MSYTPNSSISGIDNNLSNYPLPSLNPAELSFKDLLVQNIAGSHYERITYLKFKQEDILAMSCAWWRHRNSPESQTKPQVNFNIGTLTDARLLNLVTDEDRHLAGTIRDYYNKLIVLWSLKGKRLSNFRTNLREFLGDSVKVREDHLGIAFHLPSFYAYDHKLDEIRNKNFSESAITKEFKSGRHTVDSMKLIPIDKLHRKTKLLDNIVYWLKTKDTDVGVEISVGRNNELLPLWDTVFNLNQPLVVSGIYSLSDRHDFEHYTVTKWKIVNLYSLG